MRQTAYMTASKILLAGAIAIIGACILAYIPAIKAGFIWDDDLYVTENPLLTAPDGFHRIWFSNDSPSQYFPLTYSTYWVEHRLWGFNPMGYHVVNVAIHIINALLVWLVLRRLSIPGAWFASAIFALHPVNVESVAWITERKNVLMLLFSLLSVLCWMKFALDNKSVRRANLFYAGSLFLYVLALYSKTTACTLPAALVLILWLKHIPLTLKRWLQIAPFVAIGIVTGLVTMWWEKYYQGTGLVNLGLSLTAKLLIAGRALWFYLGKLFWPLNLTFSYPRWHIDPAEIWQYAWPVAGVSVLACLWLWRKRLGRGLLTAMLFFVATLVPMLGFFSLYTFVYSFAADHYQYAACIGPIALVAAGGALVLRRAGGKGKMLVASTAGVLLLTLGVITSRQVRIYMDEETLWQDTLVKNPASWLAHNQMGGILFTKGKIEDAKAQWKQAIELSSYMQAIHPRAYADLYCNLAFTFKTQANLDDAAANYRKALEIFENSALTHYQLAEILVGQGKNEQALLHYRRALEIARAKKADYLAKEIQQRLKTVESHK